MLENAWHRCTVVDGWLTITPQAWQASRKPHILQKLEGKMRGVKWMTGRVLATLINRSATNHFVQCYVVDNSDLEWWKSQSEKKKDIFN